MYFAKVRSSTGTIKDNNDSPIGEPLKGGSGGSILVQIECISFHIWEAVGETINDVLIGFEATFGEDVIEKNFSALLETNKCEEG